MNRSPKITSLFYALAALLLFAKPSSSQIPNQAPVGARPLSMGEAFVAVADDGNAIHWNPAGLANMERIQLSLSHADLFGLGIKNTYTSFLSRFYFIPPLTDYLSFGVAWSDLHTSEEEDPQEVGYNENHVNFALAFKPPGSWLALRHLRLGMNAKYLQLGGKYNGITAGEAKGWGGDFGLLYDFGALFSGLKKSRAARDTAQTDASAARRKNDPPPEKATTSRQAPKSKNPINSVLRALAAVPQNLQFGLMVHDIGGTEIKHHTGVREPVQFQQTTLGFCFRPPEKWFEGKLFSDPVLALDFNDRVHVGLEFWLAKMLALRAGWQKDWHTTEKASFAFGLGFKKAVKNFPEARVDYAFTDTPVLPNTTRQFGGSLLIKNNPRLIRIERVDLNEVFASLYRYYEKPEAKLGVVKLRNVYHEPLTAYVSLLAGKYAQAHPDTIVIAADSTVEHKLRAFFNTDLLDFNQNRLPGEVNVTYEYNKTSFSSKAEVLFPFYIKNFITWGDPAKAAAFITPEDPWIKKFIGQILYAHPNIDSTLGNQFFNALAIFESLSAYGVRYKLDENYPFTEVTATSLDQVKYPKELLQKKKIAPLGDCDDLAVLYSTLLESAGINTALVSIPDHIFMIFDTGLPINQKYRFKVEDRMLVSRNGMVWLPIETTLLNTSFVKAWQEGVERYRQAERNSLLEVIPFAEARLKYAPPQPSNLQPPDPFEYPNPSNAINDNLAVFKTWNNKFIADLVRDSASLQSLNMLGIVYAQNRKIQEAQKQFEKVRQRDAKYAPALNNLANILFVQAYDKKGDTLNKICAQVEQLYQMAFKAATTAPESAGAYINLAMLCDWQKDFNVRDAARLSKLADSVLTEAGRLLQQDAGRAFELLGLPVEPQEGSGKAKASKDPKKLWKWFKKKFYTAFELKGADQVRSKQWAGPKAGEREWDIILWWSS